ncbi:ribosomal processing protein [Sarcoptes scabiei]|nr:ribosomal processing protein [Sarcoptes scabiei]
MKQLHFRIASNDCHKKSPDCFQAEPLIFFFVISFHLFEIFPKQFHSNVINVIASLFNFLNLIYRRFPKNSSSSLIRTRILFDVILLYKTCIFLRHFEKFPLKPNEM